MDISSIKVKPLKNDISCPFQFLKLLALKSDHFQYSWLYLRSVHLKEIIKRGQMSNEKKMLADSLKEIPGLKSLDLEDIEKRLKEVKERTSSFVQEYPLTSLAVALGVGYLLGKLLLGKRNE